MILADKKRDKKATNTNAATIPDTAHQSSFSFPSTLTRVSPIARTSAIAAIIHSCSMLNMFVSLLPRLLHIHVEPRDPAGPEVEGGLAGDRSVPLVGVHVESSVFAQAVERREERLRVDGIRTDVGVLHAVVH